ncbi:MAG TPA: hypothetical protein VGH87_03980 [Polyangiaceae bacterium]|jgi:hypothetical protein
MTPEKATQQPGDAYDAALIGNAFVVRWKRAPTVIEVNNLLREVVQAARGQKNLLCMAIVPGTVNPPEDEARRQMMANTEKILAVADAMHFVIEGSGFKHVMLRSVVTGLILVSGRRGRIVVHNSFDDAARAAGPSLTVPVAQLVSTARAQNLSSPME